MEIKDYLTEYYAHYDEEGRLARNRRGQVEYVTTMTYLRRYLRPGCRVLELGAGTGRYSVTLAGEGYDVTAVELVEHNLEQLRGKITPDMSIRAIQGNALNLSMLEPAAYDLTLLFGPLYHLFTWEDKRQAISEALRVTKPGGIVMAAYCISEGSILEYAFRRGRLWELIREGMLDPDTFVTRSKPSDLFDMVRKGDIDRMMADFSVERLHYVAAEGFSYFMRQEQEEMDEDTFRMFLRYHLTVCEHPDLVGVTAHSLDIFRRC